MDDLRYPIGRFSLPSTLTDEQREQAIATIASTPATFRTALHGLIDEQLDTPYRTGGWTLRQVAHHLPDSHANAYIRFKLALTEDTPTIKSYDEAAWALLEDSRSTPIGTSLSLLDAVHDRWVRILRSMSADDFSRKLNHQTNGLLSLDQMLAMYAWHGLHHTAHVTNLRQQHGW